MLLRISEERLGGTAVVCVAGRLVGPAVEELRRVCAASPCPYRIDLSGILQADELGVALLRSLRDSGVELAGGSPFIELLLDNGRERAEK